MRDSTQFPPSSGYSTVIGDSSFGSSQCDIFGVDHIWLQSDAAFVYPRLDSTA